MAEMERTRIPILDRDVIDEILDRIRPDDNSLDRPDFDWILDLDFAPAYSGYKYLASLCLISRLWLPLARRRLYRVIPSFLPLSQRANLFKATILTVPELRPLVHRVYSSQDDESLWEEVIPLLPYARVLIPDHPERTRYAGDIIPQSLFTLKSLSLLSMPGPDLIPPVAPKLWVAGFQGWTNLKELRLVSFDHFLPDTTTIDTPLPSLSVLGLRESSLFRIPPTSQNTLRTLVLDTCIRINLNSFSHLIHHHTRSLRNICLKSVHFDKDGMPPDFLESAISSVSALEILFISGRPFISTAVSLYTPPSLRQLWFDCSSRMKADECLDLITTRGGRLQCVHVTVGAFAGKREWMEVQSVAKSFGIEFSCTWSTRHIGYRPDDPSWTKW
jgi:hypothetical protein